MAQRTVANLISLARLFGQDNDVSSNYGVVASDALLLANDVLLRFTTNVRSKVRYLGASSTGLTFTSGTVYVETGDNTGDTLSISEFASFHPSNSSTLAYPVAPALKRVTVEEIVNLLGYDGDNALAAQASEWTHVAAEKVTGADVVTGSDKWRVWAYPVINRTRYLTVKFPSYTKTDNTADTPDLDENDFNYCARFLAWEIGSLNRLSEDKLNRILAPIPEEIRNQMDRGSVADALAQDRVDWRDW